MQYQWTVAEMSALSWAIVEAPSPLLVRRVLVKLERGDVTIGEAVSQLRALATDAVTSNLHALAPDVGARETGS
jgi:hypothetical protein